MRKKNNNMDKFDEAENKGRSIVKNLIDNRCVRYEFTTGKNPIDLFVTGLTDMAAIEIKDREKYTADQVEGFGGMYIMEHKYKHLTGTTLNGYKPIFCTIFKDKIALWDVSNMDITFHDEWLKNTEVINTGWSWQSVSTLSIKDAIRLYETDKYKGKDN